MEHNKLLLTLMLLVPIWASAQDIEVKKFEPIDKDQTATLSPRKDINGKDCALVLVHTLKTGIEFEGWVVGDVDCKDDAYWVYVANGAKHIKIKHADYQTKDVIFGDYNIGSLKSGEAYNLYLTDDSRDIINKVYSKGWNIGDFEVPQTVKQILRNAASRGDKKAQIAMAQLTLLKNGDSYQNKLAYHWIEQLLSKGDSSCLDSMPGELMYAYACKIIKKDKVAYSEASKYDLKACLKGYNEAGNTFFIDYIQGYGLPDYKKEVLQLCEDSASVGNVYAMTCLGHIYEYGICEEINLHMAAKWYQKAFDLYSSDQTKTDLCRVFGNEKYKIDNTSMKFIRQHANEKFPEALYQIGCMYEEGRNVEQDIEKAIELYIQSGITGNNRNHKASYRLAKIYYERNRFEEAEKLLIGVNNDLFDDEFDARYLLAIILYRKEYEKTRAFNILNDLSKKGYQKATDFINENY